jgi:hypothetical protein
VITFLTRLPRFAVTDGAVVAKSGFFGGGVGAFSFSFLGRFSFDDAGDDATVSVTVSSR